MQSVFCFRNGWFIILHNCCKILKTAIPIITVSMHSNFVTKNVKMRLITKVDYPIKVDIPHKKTCESKTSSEAFLFTQLRKGQQERPIFNFSDLCFKYSGGAYILLLLNSCSLSPILYYYLLHSFLSLPHFNTMTKI